MLEIFIAVSAFGFGLWLGWSAGVQHGEARVLDAEVSAIANKLALEHAQRSRPQSDGWGEFRQQAEALAQEGDAMRLVPSEKLAALIGPDPITVAEAYRRVLTYAESNDLPLVPDGFVEFDGPMRLAFVAPQSNAAGLAMLVKKQLRVPEKEACSERSDMNPTWADGPLGSTLRDEDGQLLAKLELMPFGSVTAKLYNDLSWEGTGAAGQKKDKCSRMFSDAEEAKRAVAAVLTGREWD